MKKAGEKGISIGLTHKEKAEAKTMLAKANMQGKPAKYIPKGFSPDFETLKKNNMRVLPRSIMTKKMKYDKKAIQQLMEEFEISKENVYTALRSKYAKAMEVQQRYKEIITKK